MQEKKQRQVGIGLILLSLVLIVSLFAIKSNFDAQGTFLCEAVAADPGLDMQDCPVHTGHTTTIILLGFGASVAVLLGGIYLVRSSYSSVEPKKPKKRVDVSKLSEDEKQIYTLLQQHDGSMYQSDLVKETGLSKVKTTRTLDKLEGRGVIERKRRGMTNIVLLK